MVDVADQQSSKRSGNVAAGNGRVFAHTGVNPTVEPGLNVPAVAFNASTAAVLWEQPGLVGSCGPGGIHAGAAAAGRRVAGADQLVGRSHAPIQVHMPRLLSAAVDPAHGRPLLRLDAPVPAWFGPAAARRPVRGPQITGAHDSARGPGPHLPAAARRAGHGRCGVEVCCVRSGLHLAGVPAGVGRRGVLDLCNLGEQRWFVCDGTVSRQVGKVP
ncbi:hypothetical protein CHLRE_12g547727v5 [Chlamydomonas reinhardtii]|uniref:Uncharacterized protein n=1 Tax=Chlamydomonas reinhardtii TaxID=3055 RepID=A0A2K3D731_CHLRE|nr:uncharacterized protein CHLRE_12g547727v5 [Chlamydomonas reinhardtii]PNW76334.1 hypothetical protein CHLRE_12g547727v5 [Chlamydomonas reinhardtii]